MVLIWSSKLTNCHQYLGTNPNPYGAAQPGAQQTKQVVKLRVQASGLPKMDLFSKSDPMCVFYQKEAGRDWTEIGRTETISNTHNPSWNTTFTIENKKQQVCFGQNLQKLMWSNNIVCFCRSSLKSMTQMVAAKSWARKTIWAKKNWIWTPLSNKRGL